MEVIRKISRNSAISLERGADSVRAAWIMMRNRWPCNEEKYLVVGAESSGTTAISNLLFVDRDEIRFFDEGENRWVWRAYQNIYQGLAKVEDYPRLQLYDALKVPGFAMILEQYRKAFPRSKIIYCLRDPRDVLNSAYYTWKLKKPEELSTIPWVKQTWLGLTASDPVERLALRWKSYLNNASEIEDVIFVRYEDFWAAPSTTIKVLADELGLEFNEERVARLARTQLSRQSVRNYPPKGPGSWKDGPFSREQIETVERVCGEEMDRWNYERDTLAMSK